jgi:bacillithiol system protein YtxJ
MSSTTTPFPWKKLTDLASLEEILSAPGKNLIFKHSTRCSISSFALRDFERSFDKDSGINCYFLDLLRHRNISDAIAERTGIYHESPQVIVLNEGKVVYEASHHKIDTQTINHI